MQLVTVVALTLLAAAGDTSGMRSASESNAPGTTTPTTTPIPTPIRTPAPVVSRVTPKAAAEITRPCVVFRYLSPKGGTSKVKVLDASKVYYGDAKKSTKPAVIDSQQVWDKIPEYQEIKRRGLTENDLEYWTLLKKASKKFRAAVKAAAKTKGKDLVAETGAIDVKGQTIPDLTAAVIAAIP